MENQIGRVGDPSNRPDNVGSASRAPHIGIDKRRVRKFDSRRKKMIRMAGWIVFATLALVGLGVWLILLLKWWTVALGVAALAAAWLPGQLLIYPFRALRARYELYWDSSLIGAVVVRENPLMVAGLFNVDCRSEDTAVYWYFDRGEEISKEAFEEAMGGAWEEWEESWEEQYDEAWGQEDGDAKAERIWNEFWGPVHERFTRKENEEATNLATPWGCMLCEVGEGDWSYKKGDRMPCSSAFGNPDDERGIWTSTEVIPLVWGTKNGEDLDACKAAVSDFEWNLLAGIAPLTEKLEAGELYLIRRMPEGAKTPFEFEPVDAEATEGEEGAE